MNVRASAPWADAGNGSELEGSHDADCLSSWKLLKPYIGREPNQSKRLPAPGFHSIFILSALLTAAGGKLLLPILRSKPCDPATRTGPCVGAAKLWDVDVSVFLKVVLQPLKPSEEFAFSIFQHESGVWVWERDRAGRIALL